MDAVFQISLNGLIVGSLYGIVAMGFALSYRTTHFFNLAHGSMMAIGGYAFYALNQMLGLGVIFSLCLAVLIAGLAGFLIDRCIYAPQRLRKASNAVLLVVSLGIVTVIESIISMAFGTQFKTFDILTDMPSIPLGAAYITVVQIIIIIVNISVFLGLLLLMYNTKFGRMIRAIAADTEVARTLGIRTDFYIGTMFFLVSGLAGLAGVLSGFETGLQPSIGFSLLLKGIIAGVIGGVGSISGAFLGAIFLGIAENIGVFTLGSEWRDPLAFGLLLVFLLCKPQGILGKKE